MGEALILVVEDEPTIVEVVVRYLQREGFHTVTAGDGESALRAVACERPNLIILDLMLPGLDGMDVLRRLRAGGSFPVVMLTARGEEIDRVVGLELGADDYVTKPFSPRQLIARARAVLRRTQVIPQPSRLSVGGLALNTGEQVARTPAGSIHLTGLEFRLLHLLMVHEGQVVPTEAILLHVWGYADSTDRALLKQLIYRLRQKLPQGDFDLPMIETAAGIGYRLKSARAG